MDRRYWSMVLLLPSLLLALFMTTFMRQWLWQPLQLHPNLTSWQANSSRALEMLQIQEGGILSTLNSTAEIHVDKKFLMDQLKENQELQHILLSCLQYAAPAAGAGGGCERLKRAGKSMVTWAPGVAWRPKVGRFLVAICDSGQVTNHLICLQKHMYFAAMLNRSLVLPHESLDYKYEHLLDISHIKKCLGNVTVITFEEFEERRSKDLHIDRLICYMRDCYFDSEHQAKWERLGFTFGDKQNPWPAYSDSKPVRAGDILSRFSCEDDVIAVGDLYYADFRNFDNLAVSHACQNLIQPHRLIVLTAQRYVQTYLGYNFLSLHFRRHGFLVFCNKQSPSCFFPIPQVAQCIQRKLQESNVTVIFLSTDASESEISELKDLIPVPLVMRTVAHEAQAKWDSLLWRKGLESDPAVMSMLDKAIAAMGVVFIGTRGSTFSEDIQRMRSEWDTAAACDGKLCDGEIPSFLAEIP